MLSFHFTFERGVVDIDHGVGPFGHVRTKPEMARQIKPSLTRTAQCFSTHTDMSEVRKHAFQAEVQQLLQLMIHSLYSDKDIFLRELISNSSDALDKLRFAQITDEKLRTAGEPQIRLETDKDKRTLTVWDNGIGMNEAELVENLGTIARSGTKAFLQEIDENELKERPDLIGQFGVGFYSSFMVADKVDVVSRKAGEETATHWTSTGDGNYELSEAERATHGTTITLHLKEPNEERSIEDFIDEAVIRRIVKRYSDFVAYPISMKVWVTADEGGGQVLEEKVLNSQKAIWARPKDEVTEEEYREFYRHVSHDWQEPLERVAVKMEGTFEAQALLFLPSVAPFDLFHPEMKRGVQLYVRRVFIMDECKELMPAWLRFVKGVVDAQDLPLNVSREILQKDRQIRVIRKNLVKKTLDALNTLLSDEREKYQSFWGHFGAVLKEGLLQGDEKEQARLLDLQLASSSKEASTTLAEYVERMPEEQDEIYYLTGPSLEAVQNSPHLEAFKAKGYEVLFFTDPIDEIWLERGLEFKEKDFRSVGRGEVDLSSDEEKEQAEKAREEKEAELKDTLSALRVKLQDTVKEVRLSKRLTESAACLVGSPGDPTPQMEKLMRAMGQEPPPVKRVLELNAEHPVTQKLEAMREQDDEAFGNFAELLYGQALLAEGGQLDDPAKFARLVADLMAKT